MGSGVKASLNSGFLPLRAGGCWEMLVKLWKCWCSDVGCVKLDQCLLGGLWLWLKAAPSCHSQAIQVKRVLCVLRFSVLSTVSQTGRRTFMSCGAVSSEGRSLLKTCLCKVWSTNLPYVPALPHLKTAKDSKIKSRCLRAASTLLLVEPFDNQFIQQILLPCAHILVSVFKFI